MEIVLLFCGLLSALIGAALFWQQLQALLYFEKAEGQIIALEKRTTPASESKKEGGPMYYPVVEYIAKGNKKTFTGSIGSSRPPHTIGESVQVLYSLKKDEARLKSMVPLVFGFILGGIGIVLCIFFFRTFSFSLFSTVVSAFFGVMIVRSVRNALKKRDIRSLDELKESFRNSGMKTPGGIASEQKVLITDAKELHRVEAKEAKSLKYVGPVFTIIGLAAIGLAVYLGMERTNFLETALTADGEVVKLNRKRSDDSYVYYPVVEFKLPDSYEVLTFEHDSGSNPPSYSVGEQVKVLYDPQNPQEAIIDAGVMNWFGTGLTSLFGILFTMIGIASVKRWRRFRKVKNGRST